MAVKKTAKAPSDSIKALLESLSKKHQMQIGALSDLMTSDVEVVSTGNIAINNALGVEGLPVGRSIELLGPPASGKTSTALQAAVILQQRIIAAGSDDLILYLDYEHALDLEYMAKLGLDTAHPSFLLAQPDFFEQGANVAIELIETDKVRMMIVDSVASMTPEAMLLEEVGKSTVALQARLMSVFLKKLNPLLHRNNCIAVFINHEQEVIDMGGGGRPGIKQFTSPGGKALKFYASVRVQFRPMQKIKTKRFDPIKNEHVEMVDGGLIKVTVLKNKVGPPFREVIVRTRHGMGFDNGWTSLQILLAHKKMVRSGAWHYVDTTKTPELMRDWMETSSTGRFGVQGEARFLALLDGDPEWRDAIMESARLLVAETGTAGNVADETVEEDSPGLLNSGGSLDDINVEE